MWILQWTKTPQNGRSNIISIVLVHSLADKQPIHFDFYKDYIYYAKVDGTLAPVTIVNNMYAYGSYHVFKRFVSKDGEPTKTLVITGQFTGRSFIIVVDRFCRGPACQVVRFRAHEPNAFGLSRIQSLRVGLPMIGWPYFAIVSVKVEALIIVYVLLSQGYPGETTIEHEGRSLDISYFAGTVSSVTGSYFLGSSGSRPGFSGGPVFGEYSRELIGFVIGGGPNAKTPQESCERFEHARFMIAANANRVHRAWGHDDTCISGDESEESSDGSRCSSGGI